MPKLNIAVIAGTSRPGRLSIHAAKFVYSIVEKHPEVKAVWVDVNELEFKKDGDNQELRNPEYTKITAEADAFYIVTPEYNHSYPSSLKRTLDSEFHNYKHKAVAVAGVSNGPWGGVRCIEALLPTLRTLGLVVTKADVQFPKIQDIFSEQGELKDQAYIKRVETALDELIWMAKALKKARETEQVAQS